MIASAYNLTITISNNRANHRIRTSPSTTIRRQLQRLLHMLFINSHIATSTRTNSGLTEQGFHISFWREWQ